MRFHSPRLTAPYVLLSVLSFVALLQANGCDDDPKRQAEDVLAEVSEEVDTQPEDQTSEVTDTRPDVGLGLAPCEPCQDSVDCGGENDLCLTIDVDGTVVAFCGLDCSTDSSVCPSGFDCSVVGAGISQCTPASGTCEDECLGVECGADQLCDPATGNCLDHLELCDLGCELDLQCGAPGDRCVNIEASGETICAKDCTADATVCPANYICADVGTSHQCVPSTLTCVERCAEVSCPSGQICDPYSGACRLPLKQCDEGCVANALCGTSALDVCVSLPAGDEVVCALDCSTDPTSCPAGTFCAELDGGAQNCIPSALTCRTDRCDGVNCAAGRQCDWATGACVDSLGVCDGPCTNNNACLGPMDVCLSFEAGNSFCAQNCDDTGRCPLGFGCFLLSTGGHFCIPTNQSCDFQGTTCTFETRYADCPGDSVFCSAVRPGDVGTCIPRCDNASCPSDAPFCTDLHIHPTVCLEGPLLEPAGCGRLAESANPVGRPSGENLSPFCPAPTNVCYSPLDKTSAPFCTFVCSTDADCGASAECRLLAGQSQPLCTPIACASCLTDTGIPAGTPDLLDAALSIHGLLRCDLVLTDAQLALLPLQDLRPAGTTLAFEAVMRDPLRAVETARAIAADLDLSASASALVLESVESWLGTLSPVTPESYTLDPTQPFAAAVAALITASGGTPNLATLQADAADLPLALQRELAPIVRAMADAATARDQAFGGQAPSQALFDAAHGLFLRLDDTLTPLDTSDAQVRRWLVDGDFDPAPMVDAAAQILTQLEAADLTIDGTWSGFEFNQPSPLGRIIVGGLGNTTYDPTAPNTSGDIALLVDLGGDDNYRVLAGANASLANSIAINIDLGGADTYAYPVVADPADTGFLASDRWGRYTPTLPLNQEDGPVSLSNVARQGAGRFGVGILYDLGTGTDHYESLRLSQGFGLFGVGVLVDQGGTDTYVLEAAGQGAALWGVGLLLDRDGDDDYRAWHMSQGASGSYGKGLLLDLAGDDDYRAVPGESNQAEVLYFNLYDRARSNLSLAQGTAFGRGQNLGAANDRLAGGVGVLRDAAGNDTYTAAILAQGAASYWAMGLLLDEDGADTYDGRRYVQGAGLTGSIGVLLEGAGDDHYGTVLDRTGLGQAVGDTLAVGILADLAGDDVYQTATNALGIGLKNGVGFFADLDGNDTYTVTALQSLGFAATALEGTPANDPRRAQRTVGLFIDAAGVDSYGPAGVAPTSAGDDASWTGQGDITVPQEKGVGLDGEGATGL